MIMAMVFPRRISVEYLMHFFTTSTPASFDAPRDEQMVGTGLGLKIVRDIIISYKGNICLTYPKDGVY